MKLILGSKFAFNLLFGTTALLLTMTLLAQDSTSKSNSDYQLIKIETFPSQIISPRPIEILVPSVSDQNVTFPVLYMFDGQNLFHSFKGWSGELNEGWRVDAVLDRLNRAGSLGQIIVVGIYNAKEKRGAEYMPAKPYDLVQKRIAETTHEWYQSFREFPPESDKQLRFIVEELKPYMDANFRTRKTKEYTFVAGSSMGGLISAYAICEYPDIFGGAACLSTHWSPLDGVFLEYLKDHLPDPASHKLYFDLGTEGLDAGYELYQNKVDSMMIARGFEKDVNWMTREFVGAKHHEDDWHARFHIPLQFLIKPEE